MSFVLSPPTPTRAPQADAAQRLDTHQLIALVQTQAQTIASLQHQLEWFKRQLFGKKSERFAALPDALQMHLGEVLGELPASPQEEPARTVPAHTRRTPRSDFQDGAGAPFFDETRVPVQTIALPNPEIEGLLPEQFEVIGEKVSHRLAQRPGSYVVLKYVRTVIKRLDTQALHCPPAPEGLLKAAGPM